MTTPLFTGIKICQHIANRLLYSAPPYLLPCGVTFGLLGGDEAAVTINLNVRQARKKGSPQEMTGDPFFKRVCIDSTAELSHSYRS